MRTSARSRRARGGSTRCVSEPATSTCLQFDLRHRCDPLATQVNPINYSFQAISVAQWRDYGDIDGFPPVFANGKDVLAFFSLSQRSFESNLYRLLIVGLALRSAVFVAVALTAGRRGLLEVVTEAQATENPLV